MIDKSKSFLIVGLGLIGGSYAEGLSKSGYHVAAIDPNEDSLSFALEKGWIKEGYKEPTKEIASYDIIVLGLYPSLILDWVKQYQGLLKEGAILTDVAGVKGFFIDELQRILRPDLEYIGAHPMAGKESSGVRFSSCEIFSKANYIVVPTEKNSAKAVEICRDIGVILGFASIATLSPKKHDEMIAYLSQLTHAIAMALMTCEDNESYVRYTGDSFRDLTRIAKINDALWSELFLSNKEALLLAIDNFIDKMNELREMIKNDDEEALREDMRLAKKRRLLFEKKEK